MRATEFIQEIITNPVRDEYLGEKSEFFTDQPVVAKIRNLELKKLHQGNKLLYGLIDHSIRTNSLVGLLQLRAYNSKLWQVELSQVANAYKGQGYGTFLYNYAIMNDNLPILSDTAQTDDYPGGSKGLWVRLYNQGRFKVCGYDLERDEVLPSATPADIYNQK